MIWILGFLVISQNMIVLCHLNFLNKMKKSHSFLHVNWCHTGNILVLSTGYIEIYMSTVLTKNWTLLQCHLLMGIISSISNGSLGFSGMSLRLSHIIACIRRSWWRSCLEVKPFFSFSYIAAVVSFIIQGSLSLLGRLGHTHTTGPHLLLLCKCLPKQDCSLTRGQSKACLPPPLSTKRKGSIF